MEKKPSAGIDKLPIMLALIGAAEAIFIALIYTGQVPFGRESDKSAIEQHLPPGVAADGIEFKQNSEIRPEGCLQGSQRALLAKGFRLSARTDRTITMNQGDAVALVRCRTDAIVVSAAGPHGGNMEATVAQMRSAIREELSGDVRVE